MFCSMSLVAFQWSTMKGTLDVTRESIALTKQTIRAWIVTTKIERVSDFVANIPLDVRIQLKNVGPSTTFDMTFGVSVWTCNGPPSLSCASQCPRVYPIISLCIQMWMMAMARNALKQPERRSQRATRRREFFWNQANVRSAWHRGLSTVSGLPRGLLVFQTRLGHRARRPRWRSGWRRALAS